MGCWSWELGTTTIYTGVMSCGANGVDTGGHIRKAAGGHVGGFPIKTASGDVRCLHRAVGWGEAGDRFVDTFHFKNYVVFFSDNLLQDIHSVSGRVFKSNPAWSWEATTVGPLELGAITIYTGVMSCGANGVDTGGHIRRAAGGHVGGFPIQTASGDVRCLHRAVGWGEAGDRFVDTFHFKNYVVFFSDNLLQDIHSELKKRYVTLVELLEQGVTTIGLLELGAGSCHCWLAGAGKLPPLGRWSWELLPFTLELCPVVLMALTLEVTFVELLEVMLEATLLKLLLEMFGVSIELSDGELKKRYVTLVELLEQGVTTIGLLELGAGSYHCWLAGAGKLPPLGRWSWELLPFTLELCPVVLMALTLEVTFVELLEVMLEATLLKLLLEMFGVSIELSDGGLLPCNTATTNLLTSRLMTGMLQELKLFTCS
ncbi:hypothetical protein ACROYT_G015611 [Oculina patagonica]